MTCWTEDLPELPGIYKLTNKVNGKIYIGQSKHIKGRMKGHKDKKPTVISQAIQKYGWANFKKEAIEIFPLGTPEETLLRRETFWIKFLKSHVKKWGYNAMEETIVPYVEEARKKRVEAKLRKSNKKEGKLKIEKKKLYPKVGMGELANAKPIKQIDKETGEVIRTWPSINIATQEITGNISGASAIIRVLKKQYAAKSAYGYYWEYDNTPREKNRMSEKMRKKLSESHSGKHIGEKNHMFGKKHSEETKKKIAKKRNKKVAQIDINTGEIIKIWESTKAAAKSLSRTGNRASIGHCARKAKGCHSAYGYKWEYVD